MGYRLLEESIDTLGEWFLPEDTNKKIHGKLHYEKGKAELVLTGSFTPLRGAITPQKSNQYYAIIYGVTRECELITLVRNYRSATNINLGSGVFRESDKILSLMVLIGGHFPADSLFPEISFRTPGLIAWLSKHFIKTEFVSNAENVIQETKYIVPNQAMESINIPNIDSELRIGYSNHGNVDPYASIDVEVYGWIIVKPREPQKIDWYFDQHQKISTLIAFMSGFTMAPDCIEASTDSPHNKVYIMVDLFNSEQCKNKNIIEFFMPRDHMGCELGDVMRRWFDIYETVEVPSKLAMSIFSSRNLWMHVKFLSFMQALEGFHRSQFEGNYMNNQEYEVVKQQLIKAIPDNVKDSHKASLVSRIKYGNQVSLHKRLSELGSLLSREIMALILGNDRNIPRSWVDTRNYYTHWDDELRSNILEGQQMYDANVRLSAFLRVLYINSVGIPQEAILKSLSGHNSIAQHLIQLNAGESR